MQPPSWGGDNDTPNLPPTANPRPWGFNVGVWHPPPCPSPSGVRGSSPSPRLWGHAHKPLLLPLRDPRKATPNLWGGAHPRRTPEILSLQIRPRRGAMAQDPPPHRRVWAWGGPRVLHGWGREELGTPRTTSLGGPLDPPFPPHGGAPKPLRAPSVPPFALTKQSQSPSVPLFLSRSPQTPLSTHKTPQDPLFPSPKRPKAPLDPLVFFPLRPLFSLKNQPRFPLNTLFTSQNYSNSFQAPPPPHKPTPDPFFSSQSGAGPPFPITKRARTASDPPVSPHKTTPDSLSPPFPLGSPFFPLTNQPRSPSKHPFYLTKLLRPL